jgi:hypothetical protein
VSDLKSRQQAELNGLTRQGIGAGDDGLARDHGRHRGEGDHGNQCPLGKHQEERVLDRFGVGDHKSALPQIIQCQRRQHDEEPRGLDRPLAKMPEVGIERLGSGDREEHGTERNKPDHSVMKHECDGQHGIERQQDFGMLHDRNNGSDRDHAEPDAHHRSEKRRNIRGTARLGREQREQDQHGERHHIRLERRGDELDAFDRRKHRQRRRDHGVAIEQRAAHDPEQHDGAGTVADRALRQRHQGQRAALAVVVRAKQDQHIFQRHHDNQRPQDQRDHPKDCLRFDDAGGPAGRNHGFPQRVERAGADIAIDDADAADQEGFEARGGMRFAMPIGRRRFGGGSYNITGHGNGSLKMCFTAQ